MARRGSSRCVVFESRVKSAFVACLVLMSHAYQARAQAQPGSEGCASAISERMRRELSDERSICGPELPAVLQEAIRVALANSERGCYWPAKELLRSALAASEADLGAHHPETRVVRRALAGVLYSEGVEAYVDRRYVGASNLFRRALDLTLAYPDDELSSRIQRALAFSYLQRGRGADAEYLLHRMLNASLRTLGSEHEQTLRISEHLALAYRLQGKTADARDLLEHVLSVRRRLQGDDHPDTVRVRARLTEVPE